MGSAKKRKAAKLFCGRCIMTRRDVLADDLMRASLTAVFRKPMSFTQELFKTSKILGYALAVFVFSSAGASAANWYVRPGGAGAQNGSDWSNAWDCGGISWSSVNAGDTVWLAGGAYTTTMTPHKSGNSSNLIFVKRVLSTDSVPVSAAGWQSSFDSQVVIHPSSAPALTFDQSGSGSYLCIDGRVDSGISFQINNVAGDGAVDFTAGGQSYVTFTNVEMAGPAPNSTAFVYAGGQYVNPLMMWSASPVSYITVSHSRLHGGAEMFNALAAKNIVIEYSKLYDNNVSGANPHANLVEWNNGSNLIFRYNDITTWEVEGIYAFGATGPIYIYGNVWHDPINPQTGVARIIDVDSYGEPASWGPIYFNNNDVSNVGFAIFGSRGLGILASGTEAINNIVLNSSSSLPINALNTLVTSTSPFVSASNYHLKAGSAPINAGVAISPVNGVDFSKDPDGNTRGADGAWDIGAYEYVSSNPQEPVLNNIQSTPGTNTATITWMTDENANSIVNYGLTTSYGMSVTNSSLVTSHSVALANLAQGSYYNFQVRSIDSTSRSNSSGNQIFNTVNPAIVQGLHVVSP